MSSFEQAQLDDAVDAANDEDACLATDATPTGALQPTAENLSQQAATMGDAHGGATDNVDCEMQTDEPQTTHEGTRTYQQASPKEQDASKSGKPQPREPHHLDQEQELIDYEVEEEDMIPSKKKEPAKQPTRTGEKQQPARISWNEWARPAAVDQAKRAAEMKEMEKKDESLLPDKGLPTTDGRKHRDMGGSGNNNGLSSGRYGRPAVDATRSHQRDHRRFGVRDPGGGGGGGGRERSPNRRSYRSMPHSRSSDGNMRRGTPTSRGAMPPGMNYGKAPTTHFVSSGSLKTVHPSARPMAAQGMPPGLGVTGSAVAAAPPPRNLPRPSQHPPSVEHRRATMKDGHMHRSRSPQHRPERFSRQGSLPRYDKYQRPHQQSPPPRHPDARPPPLHRSRSPPPNRDAALPYADRPSVQQRQPSQRSSGGGGGSRSQLPLSQQQQQRQEHPTHAPYRGGQRLDNGPSLRLRDGVPASPRRFIPPDKRDLPYQRPHPAGTIEPHPYNRGFAGNAMRHPGSAHWSPPPPRDHHPRRPISPNLHRSGASRRSPPLAQPPLRRPPRDLSPSLRPRREAGDGGSFRRRGDPPLRPDYFNGERDRRLYGGPPSRGEPDSDRRMETSAGGRYGNHHRDPPHSPGRNVKRQRHSPPAEQRFRRDPAHHRNLMNSPHENPPNPDVASTVVLRHPENECAWYYVDPQGNTQGPCTIAQFRSWLRTLAEDPRFADEHKQFMSVDVWKEGMQKKQLMTELLQHNNP